MAYPYGQNLAAQNQGLMTSVTSGGLGGVEFLNAPAKQRETIGVALQMQIEHIGCVLDLLNKLESQLHPVLGPSQPRPADGNGALTSAAGFLDLLRENNGAIAQVGYRIGELLDRLHI